MSDAGRTHESLPQRRWSMRMKGYDYSQAGAYFVTICAQDRACIFGDVMDDEMVMNDIGQVASEVWHETESIRPNVILDEWVVMPNHLHGILVITDQGRGVLQYAPTESIFRPPSQTIGAIVRGIKSAVTKRVNVRRGTPGRAVWQRNYYEHVIRDEDDLVRIREYIANNPAQWELDRENPSCSADKRQSPKHGVKTLWRDV